MNGNEFARKYDVRVRFTEIGRRATDGWPHTAYTATVTYNGRRASFTYRVGLAIPNPDAGSLLECLAMDYQTSNEYTDVSDYARDFCYNKLSEAKKVWNTIQRQSVRLEKLFGELISEFAKVTDE